MSVHLNDRQALNKLLHLAEAVLVSPFMPNPTTAAALELAASDLAAARNCPSGDVPIGAAEAILCLALQMLAGGGAETTDERYRYVLIAQHAVPIVQRRYGEIVYAAEMRRQAGAS